MDDTIYAAQSYTVGLERVKPTTPAILIRDAIHDYLRGKLNLRAEYVNAKVLPVSR